MIVVLNGELRLAEDALVPVSGALASFGEGALEVFRTTAAGPYLASRHIARLRRACQRLDIPAERLEEELVEDLAVLSSAGKGPWRIRLIRSRATLGAGAMRALMAEPFVESELIATGARLTLREGIVTPLGLKTSSYVASRVLRREALSAGFDECLLHHGGELLEGASSNICIVRDATLVTPKSPWILEGITLGRMFELAEGLGLRTSRRSVHVSELAEADELFITSAVRGPIPVRQVDSRAYPLRGAFLDLRRSYEEDIRRDESAVGLG